MRMVPKFIVLIFSLAFLSACSTDGKTSKVSPDEMNSTSDSSQPRLAKNFLTDCKKLYKKAKSMDSTLMLQNDIDTATANLAIKSFADFAYYCASDSMSPVFLIKTAQVARAINNISQAKVALEHCIDNYLNFKDRPAALFLLAQLYDEPMYLNNENEAKHLYDQIIVEYPKSDWALNAQAALTFLGKSDKDIMKEFNRKNKAKKKN